MPNNSKVHFEKPSIAWVWAPLCSGTKMPFGSLRMEWVSGLHFHSCLLVFHITFLLLKLQKSYAYQFKEDNHIFQMHTVPFLWQKYFMRYLGSKLDVRSWKFSFFNFELKFLPQYLHHINVILCNWKLWVSSLKWHAGLFVTLLI